ncbi:MAG: hypothetical protein BGO01_00870 [Armatimonadetes bacterium 55-13]|nr:hypothetical protein [Armatimonadota bacterium]OJU62357.1 MAG: hypothetical protein BGO01_00870 [Armatimonadetes bacterium 55-13]
MAQVETGGKTLGEKMQSLSKNMLYLVLVAVISIPLLFMKGCQVPGKPEEPTIELFYRLMTIPEGSTVLLSSDWTNSTRGESAGQFEALMRILMRRNVKVCIFTSADPQAPQVARDEMLVLNAERVKEGEKPYEQWNDYLVLGYFPNAEGTLNAIRANVRKAFAGRKKLPPGETNPRDVFESPVLQNIQKVEDFSMVVVVTASKTSNITLERLSDKISAQGKLAMMVTGVMGPETQVYYSSGQLSGLSKGLKGVFELEQMMEKGLNYPSFDEAPIRYEKYKDKPLQGFPGKTNAGKGTAYYPTLHFALGLLIVAVIVGNIGMALSRRRAA